MASAAGALSAMGTTRAWASIGEPSAWPRGVHGASVTRLVCCSRLTLPLFRLVTTNTWRPSVLSAHQAGVGTGAPVRRNVVRRMYRKAVSTASGELDTGAATVAMDSSTVERV